MQDYGQYLSPSNIEQFFQGLQFPCSKQDLMDYAEDQNAPPQVLDVIMKMPDKQYNSVADVVGQAVKNMV